MTAVLVRPLVGLDLPVAVQAPPWAIKPVVTTVVGPNPGHCGCIWDMATSRYSVIVNAVGSGPS